MVLPVKLQEIQETVKQTPTPITTALRTPSLKRASSDGIVHSTCDAAKAPPARRTAAKIACQPHRAGISIRIPWSECSHLSRPANFSSILGFPCIGMLRHYLSRTLPERQNSGSGRVVGYPSVTILAPLPKRRKKWQFDNFFWCSN